MRYTDERYEILGAPGRARSAALDREIDSILPTSGEGYTVSEIREQMESDRAEGAVRRTLRAGESEGRFVSSGTGKRNDPLRYLRADQPAEAV